MKNARTLTEGALLLAIYTVLMLMTAYLPVISTITIFFLVLPFIIYSEKHGIKPALIMLAAALFISLMAGVFLLTLPLTLSFGTVGIIIGWMLKNKKSKMMIYLVTSIVLLVSTVFQYIVSILFLGMNVIEESKDQSQKLLSDAIQRAEALGQPIPPERIEEIRASMEQFEIIIPSIFLILAFGMMLIIISVNFPLLRKIGIQSAKFPSFRYWKLPQSIVWYYLITLILMITVRPEMGTYLHWTLFNLFYVLQLLLFVQGLSFIYFFAYLKKWPKGLMILIIVLAFPLYEFVRIIGIIDLGFDLRQRLQRKS
ncbi:YybS family protein [Bacillus sp. P14.5]|uniref:YybS family protein n=1 Tax=Bacillus sp. P14.5 TaxID=1983400 RepID=UPI000DE87F54|nr:YybS family protein [Bacillus sp. P14.5]